MKIPFSPPDISEAEIQAVEEVLRSGWITTGSRTRALESGIACNVHYIPLPMLTAYRNMGFHIEDFPNAYAFFRNEITLPLHTLLTDTEVDYIIMVFSDIVRKYCLHDD